jgi:hypothetical protein
MADSHDSLLADTNEAFNTGNYDAARANAQKVFLEDANIVDPAARRTAIYNDYEKIASTATALDSNGTDLISLPDVYVDPRLWIRSWDAPAEGTLKSTTTDESGLVTEHFSVPGYQCYDVQPGIGHHSKKVEADGTTIDDYINGEDNHRVTTAPDGASRTVEDLDPRSGTAVISYASEPIGLDHEIGGKVSETFQIDGSVRHDNLDPVTHQPTGSGEILKDGRLVRSWEAQP